MHIMLTHDKNGILGSISIKPKCIIYFLLKKVRQLTVLDAMPTGGVVRLSADRIFVLVYRAEFDRPKKVKYAHAHEGPKFVFPWAQSLARCSQRV